MNPHPALSPTTRRARGRSRLGGIAVLGVAAALLLSGCAGPGADSAAVDGPSLSIGHDGGGALLEEFGLSDLDATEIINRLDAVPLSARATDLMASVRPDSLELSDVDGRSASVPMPETSFYVSIAPYAASTHDCFFHSLTTCTGELGNTEVDVEVTAEDGATLVDETRTTYDNGFLGLWLPRDTTVTVTLEQDGKKATQEISTGADDPTCVTTMRMA